MNQIEQSYNIIDLCTESCYSTSSLVANPLLVVLQRLKTSTDEGRRKKWGWGGQNIGQAGGVELGSDAKGLLVCKGIGWGL